MRPARHLGVGTVLLCAGALVLISSVLPIAGGFSNIISLLIIGVALFEAWRLNRRVTLQMTGPYRLATQGLALAVPGTAHVWPDASACHRCGSDLAPALLVCPACNPLVHAD